MTRECLVFCSLKASSEKNYAIDDYLEWLLDRVKSTSYPHKLLPLYDESSQVYRQNSY